MERMRSGADEPLLVTTSDGRLVGLLRRAGAERRVADSQLTHPALG